MASWVGQVDGPAFLDLVLHRHRIGPLVLNALRQLPAGAVAPALLGALADAARANAVEAVRALRTHVLLHTWLGAAGIEWLPFKGITVALRYYGEISLRQVHDQDIWVPPAQLQAARAVLAARGFRRDTEHRPWDLAERGPNHARYLLETFFEEQHHSREHGFVELHWQLTGNRHQFNIGPPELLRRADRLDVGGRSLPVMNSVDLLLYLCEHGGRHGWYRLKWLADLPNLLEAESWHWPEVLQRARGAGCLPALLLGLLLANELFAWPLPAEVAAALRGRADLRWVAGRVRLALQAPGSLWAVPAMPLVWHLRFIASSLLLCGNLRALALQLWRRTLSPKDLAVLALPDRWFWVYRLLHPVLLVWRQRRAVTS
jgi:hypothetical protein